MNRRYLFAASFLIVVAILAYGDFKHCKDLPFPPRIVATGVVFGMLDISSALIGDAAPMIGVGLVVAALIVTAMPNTKVKYFTPDCQARLAMATSQPNSYRELQGTEGTYQGTQAV